MDAGLIAIIVGGALTAVFLICTTVALVVVLRLPEPDTNPSFEPGTAVVVNTANGGSIRGVVLMADARSVTLAGPRYLDGTTDREMGGTVRIPTDKVAWTQDLTGVGANGDGS